MADACCFEAVNDLRADGLTWVDAFEKVQDKLHLSSEAARKAYYRHKHRLGNGSHYVSTLYCDGDLVAYLQYNQELLGW